MSEQHERAMRDERAHAALLFHYAELLVTHGRHDVAAGHLARAIDSFERLGDVRSKAAALFKIAHVHLAREAYPEAMDGLAEAYAIMEGLQDAQGLAHVGWLYGRLLCAAGERGRGIAVLANAAGAFTLLEKGDETQAIQTIIRELQDGKPS